jgi:hypothetical protein
MKHILFLALSMMAVLSTACGGDDNGKSEQSISFDALQPRNLSEGSFQLRATASSGLPVTFSGSDPATAVVNGTSVTLLKAGTVVITASQPGNDNYYEAPGISRTLVVSEDNNPDKRDQVITFNLLAAEWKSSYGDLTLEAGASSGLPVTFMTSNPEIAAVSGNILLLQDGLYTNESITITAFQTGNAEYNAAPVVSQTISVTHDTH